MITKKWVERKLEAHRQTEDRLDTEATAIKRQVGYHNTSKTFHVLGISVPVYDYSEPIISVVEKLDAICAYLGIEIVKEEKIVAKKIKKAK